MSAFGQAGASMRELFQENIFDLVSPVLDPDLDAHDLEAATSADRTSTTKASAENHRTHDGVISGNLEGVRNGLAERVLDARDSKAARSERADRQASDTAFYVMLMAQNDVGRYIAKQFFGRMSDEEALDFNSRLQAETGKSIGEWAEEILGPDAAARLPNESEADYITRIGQDVHTAITDENGQILPQYQNHALGQFFMGDYAYQRVVGEVMPEVQVAREADMSLAEAEAILRSEGVLDGGLSAEFAAAASAESSDQELYIALEDNREIGREVDLEDATDVAANTAAFDMFS